MSRWSELKERNSLIITVQMRMMTIWFRFSGQEEDEGRFQAKGGADEGGVEKEQAAEKEGPEEEQTAGREEGHVWDHLSGQESLGWPAQVTTKADSSFLLSSEVGYYWLIMVIKNFISGYQQWKKIYKSISFLNKLIWIFWISLFAFHI